MPATVSVNDRTVVHAASDGVVTGFPDVCLTPSGGSPVPVPYPNVALSAHSTDCASTVYCDGQPVAIADSTFGQSSGDEAGSAGGVVSGCNRGKAAFVSHSFDVQIEGQGVVRLADLAVLNQGGGPNTPSFPVVQPPLVVPGEPGPSDEDESGNEIVSIRIY